MTQSEKYIEGQWYGWNGGECPVHPETVVDVVLCSTDARGVYIYKGGYAEYWEWDDEVRVIAFRVVKHHVEPKVVWVNEYSNCLPVAHKTKELAKASASSDATRIAVRYVETPE